MKTYLRFVLIFALLFVKQNISALMLGNFTTYDFRIMVIDNKVHVMRRDFVLDDQHYTDLGDISKDRLPLTVKVWPKDVTLRDDSTLLAEFKIQSVPEEEIILRDNDIWLIYRDPEEDEDEDEGEDINLKITNLTNQDDDEPEVKPLPPTPTPEPLPPVKEVEVEPAPTPAPPIKKLEVEPAPTPEPAKPVEKKAPVEEKTTPELPKPAEEKKPEPTEVKT